jgi:hypothetical protein
VEDGINGRTLGRTGVTPMKDVIALRKGRVEAASDSGRLAGAMEKDGNDLQGDAETNGPQIKKQTMDDAETQRGVAIGEAARPERTGTVGMDTQGTGDCQGEKRRSFCEQRKRDESTDLYPDEPDASHEEVKAWESEKWKEFCSEQATWEAYKSLTVNPVRQMGIRKDV